MKRKVIGTNRETIEAYVYKREESGCNSNDTIFFEDDIIYSYGYHFPMAKRFGDVYVVNMDKYSRTTSTHQTILKGMIPLAQQIRVSFLKLEHAGIFLRTMTLEQVKAFVESQQAVTK
jgi:hypothetical protein